MYEVIKSAAITTAVLLPIILAIVTYAGKLGLSGRGLLLCSLITGFILGVVVQAATTGWPATFPGWVALLLFGLIPGLTASGVYDTGKHLAMVAAERSDG